MNDTIEGDAEKRVALRDVWCDLRDGKILSGLLRYSTWFRG